MTELTGHTSPDTAYLVTDYPYGFRLRTEIRYWIETKAGHGQRAVSQTRDPKRAGNPWNKPKPSTYNLIRVLYLADDTGHVEHDALSDWATEEQIAAFVAKYPETCADERNAKAIKYAIARARASQRVTWTVTSNTEGPTQTLEEQADIVRKLTAIEYHKL